MSTFADAFREIVVPDLRNKCRAQGLFIALDIAGFAEAVATVMRSAIDRGAANLPDKIQTDLYDWISTTILRAADGAERRNADYKAISDRVAADCDRYFAAFAEAEEMAW